MASCSAHRAACIASGVPANLVGQIQANQQTQTLSGGNSNLEPEVADTYTVGFVYTPGFLPRLAITVDYFDIEVKDAINTFGGGTANILATCYGPLVQGNPNSPYCSAISRAHVDDTPPVWARCFIAMRA